MTRFDADDAAGRQKLVAEAIRAHRERESPYLTLEAERPGPGDDAADAGQAVDGPDDGGPDDGEPTDDGVAPGDGGASDDPAAGTGAPWVQFAGDVVNLDLTDAEFDRLEGLLGEFPAFKVREVERPESAEGTNVKVGALADAARVAQFVDRVFREVYGLGDGYRLWAVEV